MSAIIIELAPGGCVPGTLFCDCGGAELALWTPQLGTRCSKCGKSFIRADSKPLEVGRHMLREVPRIDLLDGWDA